LFIYADLTDCIISDGRNIGGQQIWKNTEASGLKDRDRWWALLNVVTHLRVP
jgi:hypothetical protein